MTGAIIHVALWLVLIPPLAAALYLGALAVLALLPRRRTQQAGTATRRFAILAPACNEEHVIADFLASARTIDYPRDRYAVTVIADNCDDRTAGVARAAGVDVVERCDPDNTGKGHALTFALERLPHDVDAVVLVDADCTVAPSLLRAFAAALDAGEHVVQAHYTMRRASDAPDAVLRELALALVHLVRPLGKRRFGGSAGLKGSGMCFSRTALARAGWRSFGLAEDAEQHARVLLAGMRVAFAPQATVTGRAPARLSAAASQHRRWEAGRIAAARAHALPLLLHGLRRRSVAALDAAFELIVPPVSVPAATLLAVGIAALVLSDDAVAVAAIAGVAALALYLGAGALLTPITLREFARAVIAIPGYLLWKTLLYAKALVSKPARWEKTERADADPASAR